ncbi:hypothetical protein J2W58_000030 [Pseudomonas psychrotolerans]|nr:hypothetical protein [Pseudomonas psychrotolerans]
MKVVQVIGRSPLPSGTLLLPRHPGAGCYRERSPMGAALIAISSSRQLIFISIFASCTIPVPCQLLPVSMTASRRPPRTTGRSAKPDSLRAAHEQITRNSGTLADIANLIEMEGKGKPAHRQPGLSSRTQNDPGAPAGKPRQQAASEASRGPVLTQRLFGIPILAILGCALIVGAAVGIPLGVLTYGTEIYSLVMDGLAIF